MSCGPPAELMWPEAALTESLGPGEGNGSPASVLVRTLLPQSRVSLWDCITRAMDIEFSLIEERTGSHVL